MEGPARQGSWAIAPSTALSHSVPQFESLEQLVQRCSGKRVIRKLLVANNGIAAVKCIRSIRQWSYYSFGDDRRVRFVVMATPDDLKAGAEYIKLADSYEEVPGGRNNRNFANVDVIVDVALRQHCDAVWAGWGHASEYPTLPAALKEAGVTFLGPGARAMHDLGDKIASSILAQSANVPCIPWSGDGVTVNYKEEGIPEEKFKSCCVTNVEECRKVVERIGLPLMIKASEGGGGKGIRKVETLEQLEDAFHRVQTEIPGSPIFMMRLGKACRHLEVQVLADEHGSAIAIYGRDCSIQRRHQKIIEEGPVVVADAAMRHEMEAAAVRMTREVGYVGAGTIEYLYTNGRYYFLELNPRLQVEHPVSELISNINLPAAQLCVGMGIPLQRIPQIRMMYGVEPFGTAPLDLETAVPNPPKGHVIACRITAENPREGFQPTSGSIQELNFRSIPNVWGYFSVSSGGGVHEFADSQIGHLFAWGPTRDFCRNTLILGLKELSIRGDISTPVDYLIRLMETAQFRSNDTHTEWLDELIAGDFALLKETSSSDSTVVICGAIFQAYRFFSKQRNDFTSQLQAGRIPSRQLLATARDITILYNGVKYDCFVRQTGSQRFSFEMPRNGAPPVQVEIRSFVDGGLLVIFDEKSRLVYLTDSAPDGWKMTVDGEMYILEQERDPTLLLTPSNGKLIRYLVPSGEHVDAGTPYCEVEIMKMVLPLVCEVAGTITHSHAPGTILNSGELIARVQLDDPSSVQMATPYEGAFPAMSDPRADESKAHLRLRSAEASITNALMGYAVVDATALVDRYLLALTDERVLLDTYREALAEYSAVIAPALKKQIEGEVARYAKALQAEPKSVLDTARDAESAAFPASAILRAFDAHGATLSEKERESWSVTVSGFLSVVESLNVSQEEFEVRHITQLVQRYLKVESLFAGRPKEVVMLELRDGDDIDEAFSVCMAYFNNAEGVDVLYTLFNRISRWNSLSLYRDVLRQLYTMRKIRHVKLSLIAGRLLARADRLPDAQRRAMIQSQLSSLQRSMGDAESAEVSEAMQRVLRSHSHQTDVLFCARDMDSALSQVCLTGLIRQLHAFPFDWEKAESREKAPQTVFHWRYSMREAAAEEQSPSAANASKRHQRSHSDLLRASPLQNNRYGMAVVFSSIAEACAALETTLQLFAPSNTDNYNVLKVLVLSAGGATPAPSGEVTPLSPRRRDPSLRASANSLTQQSAAFQAQLLQLQKLLEEREVARVTLAVAQFGYAPLYFTYRRRSQFAEDLLYRNVSPAVAYHLELHRLTGYKLQHCMTDAPQVVVYYGSRKNPVPNARIADNRLFARALIQPPIASKETPSVATDLSSSVFSSYFASEAQPSRAEQNLERVIPDASQNLKLIVREIEHVLNDALDSMEFILSDSEAYPVVNAHLFLKLITRVSVPPKLLLQGIHMFMETFGPRFNQLNVPVLEIVHGTVEKGGETHNLRVYVSNPSGHFWRVNSEAELTSVQRLRAVAAAPQPTSKANSEEDVRQARVRLKRLQSRRLDSTYIYDWLDLFERALRHEWREYRSQSGDKGVQRPEGQLLQSQELRWNAQTQRFDEIAEPEGGPGSNKVGVVVWRLEMRTPQYPKGRRAILIGNDVTTQGGSFGPEEDEVFFRASALARQLRVPRLYVSANAGARIGLAKEVQSAFCVAWVDAERPEAGIDYLYLDAESAAKLADSVVTEQVEGHPERHRITDVIGAQHGIGVENLQGSGLIAGETSVAYRETFTLTIVTARSVGIGAYVTRLGQRVIQSGGPILLTGFDALNRLLGREVYISHTQMGGPHIMYRNGVSHIDTSNDLEAAMATVRWLSYVADAVGNSLPRTLQLADAVDRDVLWAPTLNKAYDPRCLLCGETVDGEWVSGLFDRDSFFETMGGWANTVVTGRARLGGIPVGVIAVETRSVTKLVPADPATEESREAVVQQAGQVWYPDSAYKTAQAINDFNTGEALPLFILANWRGFSGGVADMFDEILKFGSMIVDALAVYSQPVFVYLPPLAELRGGAWAVLDPKINAEGMIEMYSSESARAGILEPTGTIEIKFRQKDKIAAMRRLDAKVQALQREKETLQAKLSGGDGAGLSAPDKAAITMRISETEKALKERFSNLNRIYHQVALRFAELHDTPGRMLRKNTIRDIVQWRDSRRYFHGRLQRRLKEEELVGRLRSKGGVSRQQALEALYGSEAKKEDAEAVAFLEESGEEAVKAAHKRQAVQALLSTLRTALKEDASAVSEALAQLSPQERQVLVKYAGE